MNGYFYYEGSILKHSNGPWGYTNGVENGKTRTVLDTIDYILALSGKIRR